MSTLAQVLRERAIVSLMKQGVPRKPTVAKRVDLELSKHPGDSRSRTLDAIKAIASQRTGCRIATETEKSRLGILARRNGVIVVVRRP